MVGALFISIVRGTFGKVRKAAILKTKLKKQKSRLSKVGVTANEKADSEQEAKGCMAPTNPLVVAFRKIVSHPAFDNFISICIAVNSVFLAMSRHEQSDVHTQNLKTAESIFTAIFTAEMVMKLVGLNGWTNYLFRDDNAAWNRFDGVIVIISLVDVMMSAAGLEELPSISLLRVLRLLRIVRLLRRNPDVVKIVNALLKSVPALGNLLSFMILIMGVFAILGMQLYGGKLADPRTNFDDFGTSMVTLFRMMSGGGTWGIVYRMQETDMGSTAFLSTFYCTLYLHRTFLSIFYA